MNDESKTIINDIVSVTVGCIVAGITNALAPEIEGLIRIEKKIDRMLSKTPNHRKWVVYRMKRQFIME